MKIFGVDPGYGRFGWGVIQVKTSTAKPQRQSLQCLASGVIETPSDRKLPERLFTLQQKITQLIYDIEPDVFAMERLFFNQSSTTASGVFQAQGVFLARVGEKGGRLIELAPTTIKKTLTGTGNAKKKEVMRAVCNILQLPFPIQPDDTADALATAITATFTIHHSQPYAKLMEAQF